MPDLTAFLCALVPGFMGSKLGFVEVDAKEPNGAVLFRPSTKGTQFFDLSNSKSLTESEVNDLFDCIARGEASLG
jgi:hypothetical protein